MNSISIAERHASKPTDVTLDDCRGAALVIRMPRTRLVSGNRMRGCAVIGNNGVRCSGLGSRFRIVALDACVTQISVTPIQNEALTEAGRAFWWGNNDYGGLGIAPYDSSFIVPLE